MRKISMENTWPANLTAAFEPTVVAGSDIKIRNLRIPFAPNGAALKVKFAMK